MPLYDFECKACGHKDEEYRKMGNYAPVEHCPKCESFAYVKLISLGGTGMKEYDKPIEMFSIAMDDPDKVREFALKCPDVQISTDPDDPMYGVPIAKSLHAKKQALKESGFVDVKGY